MCTVSVASGLIVPEKRRSLSSYCLFPQEGDEFLKLFFLLLLLFQERENQSLIAKIASLQEEVTKMSHASLGVFM